MVLSCEPVDVRDCIEKCAATIAPLATKKGLELRVEAEAAPLIQGDHRRIEQILLNLASNAIKFTEHGSITLALTVRPRELSVAVRDTGIGIASADLASLFLPFRQLEAGLSRRHDGTGLGLSICRGIVEAHGGGIRAQNRAGGGLRVIVTLPAQ